MRKVIKFKCDEKIEKKRIMVENGIYNGFGKMIDLPPIPDIELLKQNFDTKELGDLFIDLGNELKKEVLNITDISIDYSFEENPVSMGKQFVVALYYETVDVEATEENKKTLKDTRADINKVWKEIYNKAFDLLLEMQKEYYRYSKALINQDDETAEDASIKFEMYLKELKELQL